MSQTVQTRENHVRFDPFFHFFLIPASLFLFIGSLMHVYRARTGLAVLIAAGFLILVLAIFNTRRYALKVQDRVIRLEERLRLGTLCDDATRRRLPELAEGQLVALRFAPDDEAAALARRALDEKLKAKEIKAAIKNWRGDYFRI